MTIDNLKRAIADCKADIDDLKSEFDDLERLLSLLESGRDVEENMDTGNIEYWEPLWDKREEDQ